MNRYIQPVNPTVHGHHGQAHPHTHQHHHHMHYHPAQTNQGYQGYMTMHHTHGTHPHMHHPMNLYPNPARMASYGYGPSTSYVTAHHQHPQHAGHMPTYDERHTAYANHVSPVALVFHGHVSPEAMQSLQQFHNPYGNQPSNAHLSHHAAHATENHYAMMRGHKF